MPQINELTTRTFDGDSLIGFDVENTDPQTQAQYPYVTGKTDGNGVSDFIANEQEYVTDLNTVDKHINGAINELHAINGYSYDAYDDTSTYAVGDLCIYNNKLYKCTTAITTAEAWNALHWTATSIADEISELNSGKVGKGSYSASWNNQHTITLPNKPVLLIGNRGSGNDEKGFMVYLSPNANEYMIVKNTAGITINAWGGQSTGSLTFTLGSGYGSAILVEWYY